MASRLTRMEQIARRSFKLLNRLILLYWRLGLGGWLNAWPDLLGRYMVLAHIGRKSGVRRLTPVNYVQIGEEVYIVAGFGSITDWYRNLRAHPQVEIWLPGERWYAEAVEIPLDADKLPILREVLRASGFVARLIGIDVRQISDQRLAEMTSNYRLIRIQKIAPSTEPNGPGDLVWVWPVVAALSATVLGLLIILSRSGRHKAG